MYECTLPVSAFYCTFNNSHHQSIKLYSNDMLERRCVHNLTSFPHTLKYINGNTVHIFGKYEKRTIKKSVQNIPSVRTFNIVKYLVVDKMLLGSA